ncbi:tryptophan synthase subunit alpha [Candidatus Margulisiibacteriota bacterium]
MSRILEAFEKRKALIAYITAGDPSLAVTEKLIYAIEKAGADIIELGVAFSDPLADGPVIQASHLRALKTSLADVIKLAAKVRKKTKIPIVLMLSDNLVVKYGTERFYNNASSAGIDGVIIPDLPPEEFSEKGYKLQLDNILLVAPTSTEERMVKISELSTGFIYLVSLTGITGQRKKVSADVDMLVKRVRKYTDKPVAIGFGISNPKQAEMYARMSDGIIVGSAIVDCLAKNKKNSVPAVAKFVSSLRRAIDR